jgi:hypothetical protein
VPLEELYVVSTEPVIVIVSGEFSVRVPVRVVPLSVPLNVADVPQEPVMVAEPETLPPF